MGIELTKSIGAMWDLASLSLNVSLNPLGPDFVKRLALQLKKLTKLTNLKLDLEKIGILNEENTTLNLNHQRNL